MALLFLLLLAFLVPLTVYFLFLASLNRRSRPVIIAGHWDCAALLLAASGFFLVVIPGLLAILYDRSLREASWAVEEKTATVVTHLGQLAMQWWWIWVLYYGAVLAVAGLVLWWRRSKTIVYNVEPDVFDRVLSKAGEELGLDMTRSGKRLVLRSRASQREAVVDVEPFATLCNVTLHWHAASTTLQDQFEGELARQLKQVTTEDNLAGGWFLGIGGFLLGLVFLIGMLLIIVNYFPRRW
jgi:hypothetical protein